MTSSDPRTSGSVARAASSDPRASRSGAVKVAVHPRDQSAASVVRQIPSDPIVGTSLGGSAAAPKQVSTSFGVAPLDQPLPKDALSGEIARVNKKTISLDQRMSGVEGSVRSLERVAATVGDVSNRVVTLEEWVDTTKKKMSQIDKTTLEGVGNRLAWLEQQEEENKRLVQNGRRQAELSIDGHSVLLTKRIESGERKLEEEIQEVKDDMEDWKMDVAAAINQASQVDALEYEYGRLAVQAGHTNMRLKAMKKRGIEQQLDIDSIHEAQHKVKKRSLETKAQVDRHCEIVDQRVAKIEASVKLAEGETKKIRAAVEKLEGLIGKKGGAAEINLSGLEKRLEQKLDGIGSRMAIEASVKLAEGETKKIRVAVEKLQGVVGHDFGSRMEEKLDGIRSKMVEKLNEIGTSVMEKFEGSESVATGMGKLGERITDLGRDIREKDVVPAIESLGAAIRAQDQRVGTLATELAQIRTETKQGTDAILQQLATIYRALEHQTQVNTQLQQSFEYMGFGGQGMGQWSGDGVMGQPERSSEMASGVSGVGMGPSVSSIGMQPPSSHFNEGAGSAHPSGPQSGHGSATGSAHPLDPLSGHGSATGSAAAYPSTRTRGSHAGMAGSASIHSPRLPGAGGDGGQGDNLLSDLSFSSASSVSSRCPSHHATGQSVYSEISLTAQALAPPVVNHKIDQQILASGSVSSPSGTVGPSSCGGGFTSRTPTPSQFSAISETAMQRPPSCDPHA